jgi:hypothetical protein
MYKNIFGLIDGISIYPIVGLLIFLGAFGFVLVRIVRMKKSEIEYLENLPLEKCIPFTQMESVES